jgi:hypothetical protein
LVDGLGENKLMLGFNGTPGNPDDAAGGGPGRLICKTLEGDMFPG